MLMLLALTTLGMVTVGSLVVYQKQHRQLSPGREVLALPPAKTVERTLHNLRAGDVVVVGNEDWLIVESHTYREEDTVWFWHQLEGGDAVGLGPTEFLEIRERGEWVSTFFKPVDDLPASGSLGNGLTFRGQPYQLEGRGDALVTSENEGPSERIRYVTFTGPGGALLNVEDRSNGRTGFIGERVSKRLLSFMPGSPIEKDGMHDFGDFIRDAEANS